jgi:hypothetical protein
LIEPGSHPGLATIFLRSSAADLFRRFHSRRVNP